MSTEQNKAILRRWMEGWSTRSLSVMDTLADDIFAVDYVLHDPGLPDMPPGPAGVKQFVHGVLGTSPDISVKIDELVAEGDRVLLIVPRPWKSKSQP